MDQERLDFAEQKSQYALSVAFASETLSDQTYIGNQIWANLKWTAINENYEK